MKLKDNKILLAQLLTTDKVIKERKKKIKEKWKGVRWKKEDRIKLEKDINKCKYSGYDNREIADYFGITEITIAQIVNKINKENKVYYETEWVLLLLEQVKEIDLIILDIKKSISYLNLDQNIMKIRYLELLNKYYTERAKLLKFTENSLIIRSENWNDNPIDKILEAIKN